MTDGVSFRNPVPAAPDRVRRLDRGADATRRRPRAPEEDENEDEKEGADDDAAGGETPSRDARPARASRGGGGERDARERSRDGTLDSSVKRDEDDASEERGRHIDTKV